MYVRYHTDLYEKLLELYMRDVTVVIYLAYTHWQLCTVIVWQLATPRVLFVISVGLDVITYT